MTNLQVFGIQDNTQERPAQGYDIAGTKSFYDYMDMINNNYLRKLAEELRSQNPGISDKQLAIMMMNTMHPGFTTEGGDIQNEG